MYKKEYVLSKQILRSGKGIAANIKEALEGQSRKDFIAKLSIALKEAGEKEYYDGSNYFWHPKYWRNMKQKN